MTRLTVKSKIENFSFKVGKNYRWLRKTKDLTPRDFDDVLLPPKGAKIRSLLSCYGWFDFVLSETLATPMSFTMLVRLIQNLYW